MPRWPRVNRSLFLAAYDIREPARLRRALRVIKNYACGGQKSAYECWLAEADIPRVLEGMRDVMDSSEDQFALIPLDSRRKTFALGIAVAPTDPTFFYFG